MGAADLLEVVALEGVEDLGEGGALGGGEGVDELGLGGGARDLELEGVGEVEEGRAGEDAEGGALAWLGHVWARWRVPGGWPEGEVRGVARRSGAVVVWRGAVIR